MRKIKYIQYLYFILPIACCLCALSAYSQNTLSGNIKSAKDSSALSGVIIYLPDIKAGAVSKSDGSYKIENLPKGSFLIEARLVGYGTVTKYVNIEGNKSFNFRLFETNIDMNEVVITGSFSVAKDLQRHLQLFLKSQMNI